MAASKNPATNLEYWTEFFHRANGSIFDVIDNAIAVAANDFPQELRSRRDRIVEKIYTAAIPRCFSCIERCNQQLEEAGSVKHERENREKGKEGPEDIGRMVVSGSGGSNCSYDEVEAITEEIERETEVVGEVLRINECLLVNLQEQSESSVLEHLTKLQLMELSVQTLQATEIGKAVARLKKHKSKKVRQLARILIEGWKELVDEWVSSNALLEDKHEEHESNAPEEEEEGLPSPPLDEGAFFATQTTAIQLDEIFDGMDDDGNLKPDSEIAKKGETENSFSRSKGPVTSQEQPRSIIKQTQPSSLHKNTQMNLPGNVSKPSRSVKVESGPGRPPYVTQNLSAPVQRKLPAVAQDKLKSFEDDKLEAAKKRLHEGYQQAQNAKKQRTIQMLNEKEIPKPKIVPQHRFHSHNQKPKNGIRSWAARH